MSKIIYFFYSFKVVQYLSITYVPLLKKLIDKYNIYILTKILDTEYEFLDDLGPIEKDIEDA